jgi:hypothetical protein
MPDAYEDREEYEEGGDEYYKGGENFEELEEY